MIRNKFLFYLLSFTWGLLMTTAGCIVALALLITRHKPQKWGYCYYFEVGKNWGGLEFGPIFLVDKNSLAYIKKHELGHGMQNCWLGPLFPFIVCIPSATRYWLREFKTHKSKRIYAAILTACLALVGVGLMLIPLLAFDIFGCLLIMYTIILAVWLFFVEIPQYDVGKKAPGYYDIWFERQASNLGKEFINWYDNTKRPQK